jgi:hypothetical protein
METHVKVLGVLHIVLGALWVLLALMLTLAFGSAVGIVGAAADGEEAAIAIPIIGVTGFSLVIFILALAIPGIVVGVGLLKFRPWARIVGIVLSAINLINIPIGTVVGIYGLWVLLTKETERLFGAAPPSQDLRGTTL